jgi:hypothetical protein
MAGKLVWFTEGRHSFAFSPGNPIAVDEIVDRHFRGSGDIRARLRAFAGEHGLVIA